MGYSSWGLKELDSTEQLNYPVLGPQKFLKVAGTRLVGEAAGTRPQDAQGHGTVTAGGPHLRDLPGAPGLAHGSSEGPTCSSGLSGWLQQPPGVYQGEVKRQPPPGWAP